MVGEEYNDKFVDGLFAATPPPEGLRLLLGGYSRRARHRFVCWHTREKPEEGDHDCI